MEIYKKLLTKKLFYQFVLLFIGLILSTFFETLSFGSVIIFLGVLTEPELITNKINHSLLSDFIIKTDTRKLILYSSFFLFFMFLIRNTFLGFIQYFSRKFIYNIVTHNSKKLFNYYLNCPLIFHYERKPEVIARNVETLLYSVCERLFYYLNILREILMMIVILIIVLSFNTLTSTIVFLVLLLISFFFISLLKKTLKKRSLIAHKHDVSRLKTINEFYFNLKEIKLYKLQKKVLDQFTQALKGVEAHRVFFNTTNVLPRLFLELTAISGILFLAIISSSQEFTNQSILTSITIIAICASRLIPGFQQISTAVNVLNNTKFAIKIIKDDVLNFDNYSSPTLMDEKNLGVFKSIELKGINFSYSKNVVLKDINLKINNNDKVCIIGESGSGKSTLISILMGLYDIQKGKLEINGIERNNSVINAYQSQVGYVAQDVFLLDDTILNNITLGQKNNANKINIDNVINITNLSSLIKDTTDGLQAQVGTKGIKLSGGQIQRLGIARALYRDPNIIFFDEATSSLDSRNEMEIMNNIFDTFKNSTIVFITHKKELMGYFKRVISLENGKLTEL